jgi:membrane protein DedA with SNARE-associated domain
MEIMPEEVVNYIMEYGYIAIFIIVFLQELGVPNPIPIELFLLFSGYLSFKGILYLPFIIITAIAADFIGSNILYFIFYSSGKSLIQKKPRWIPVTEEMITRVSEKITNGGLWSLYFFRLISFTRGYISIVTGLLHIKPRIYLPIVIISASTWTMVYVILGYILGPSWNILIRNIVRFKLIMFGVLIMVVCILVFTWFWKKRTINNKGELDYYS